MRRPVDLEFGDGYVPVEIASFGGVGNEGEMLRSVLEWLGGVVLLHQCGRPSALLKVLAQGDSCAPYMIISGHGEEGDLILGEYCEGIDVSMLHEGKMPPEAIRQHINLPGCVVINTCCESGMRTTAQAFMHGGLKAYIAPVEAVLGSAVPLFVTHLFYMLTQHKASLRQAWHSAASIDQHTACFALYDRGGCHRVSPNGR